MTTQDTSAQAVADFLRGLQNFLAVEIEALDGGRFRRDTWNRDEGGGGDSRVLTGGKVFERAGIGFSHIHGERLPPSATQRRPELAGRRYQALGVSVVIHPQNPYAPTSHANVRYFVAPGREPGEPAIWWFGGGFDLTPYYGFEADAVAWHAAARDACAVLGPDAYPRYKQWCDEYFYLPHRNEARGIGGLFFDDLDEPDFARCFAFMQAVGEGFSRAYLPLVARRKDHPFGDRQRQFQLYRRGRYVEFNLVYDRGTLFGLQSKGRIESILMSMPPLVRWEYDYRPEPGSEEARLYSDFLPPRNWLADAQAAAGGT